MNIDPVKFDEVFRRLQAMLPKTDTVVLPELDDKLLMEAAKTAQAYQNIVPSIGREYETLTFGEQGFDDEHAQVSFTNKTHHWRLHFMRSGAGWQVKFVCYAEVVNQYLGRYVEIQLGDDVFQLGNVDNNGYAECDEYLEIMAAQVIDVRIGPKVNTTNGLQPRKSIMVNTQRELADA
jgi:hypothetical protein